MSDDHVHYVAAHGKPTFLDQKCPECGTEFDCASGFGHNRKPRVGDITVCSECGEILTFDPKMQMAKLSPEDVKIVQGEDGLWEMLLELQRAARAKEVKVIFK